MSVVCEVATIDSDHEAIVHGDHLPGGTTFNDLADYLSVPVAELLDAVHSERNAIFAHALYIAVRRDVVTLPDDGSNPFIDEPYADHLGTGVHRHELPPVESLDNTGIRAKLRLLAELGPIDARHWAVPADLFSIPFATEATNDGTGLRRDHVAKLYGLGPRKNRCVVLRKLEIPTVALDAFRAKVKGLEALLATHEALIRVRGRAPALIQRALLVAQLQERHWWSEGQKPMEDRVNHLEDAEIAVHQAVSARLADALDELHTEASKNLMEPRELRDAADGVLDLLDPRREENASFHEFLTVLGSRPELVERALRDDVLDLLERAMWAVARSPRAARLLSHHVLDLLEAACERPPRGFMESLSTLGNPAIAQAVRDGWKDVIAVAREELRAPPPRSSPMTAIGRMASTFKSTMSIVSSALSEGVLGKLLAALRARAETPVEIGGMGTKVAGVFFRLLASSATQNRGRAESLLVGSKATLSEVLAIVDAIPDAIDVEPSALVGEYRAAGQRLRELGIGDVSRTRVGASLNFIAASILMVTAFSAAPDNPIVYQASALAGLSGGAAHLPRALQVYVLGRDGPSARSGKVFKLAGTTAVHFAGFASYFGFVASVAMVADPGRRAQGYVYSDSLNAAANGLGMLGWVAELAQAARLVAFTGTAGAVLGLAALAAAIAAESLQPGPAKFVEGYIDAVRSEQIVQRAPFAMTKVDDALKAANESGTFENFRQFVGKRTDDPSRMSPTFWGCIRLGFSYDEIEKLFDTSPGFVQGVLPPE